MASDVLANLRRAIAEYDADGAERWARSAVEQHIDPAVALEAMTEAIREVGEGFNRGDLFLPDLIATADAMQRAIPVLEGELNRTGGKRQSQGTVVIGTVKGDVHSIGKNMVSTMLVAAGFDVVDLGVDVPAEKFIEAVKARKPVILAMSALMTMTAPQQKQVIAALVESGLRQSVRVIVGGGAITKEFAASIGADGYEATAPGAVILARKLVEKPQN